jgi:hypothetical protein
MDCHNRPSHHFQAPAKAVNQAMKNRKISPSLLAIREQGVELLNAEYPTKKEALAEIDRRLNEFYATEYADSAAQWSEKIQQASLELQEIYRNNFFPEMNTDYRVRENYLSHFVNDGCFRCHSSTMINQTTGEPVGFDCRSCHLIVAQGPSEKLDELEMNLDGLEFHHPEEIDEAWREYKCTECHTPESGY